MKTRNGLVSNSSSSSFVVIGYKLSSKNFNYKQIIETYAPEVLKDKELLKTKYYVNIEDIQANSPGTFAELFYELWNQKKLFNGIDGVWDSEEGFVYFGVKLAEVKSDDFGLPNKELDITECLKQCEEVRRLLKLPIDQQPKIYTGCRAC